MSASHGGPRSLGRSAEGTHHDSQADGRQEVPEHAARQRQRHRDGHQEAAQRRAHELVHDHLDGVQAAVGQAELLAGDDVGHDRLGGRVKEGLPHPEHERGHVEDGQRELAREREPHHEAHDGHTQQLDIAHRDAPVQAVGQGAGDEHEDQPGQPAGDGDTGDQRRGRGQRNGHQRQRHL